MMKSVKLIISAVSLLSAGFTAGYLVKSKSKPKITGTLNVQDETDAFFLQLDYDVPEVRKNKYVTFKVNKIR